MRITDSDDDLTRVCVGGVGGGVDGWMGGWVP